MSHLTINGHLTHNQQQEANKLNIKYTDYIQTVLENLAKENEERARKNNNIVYVECKKPVIVIGHGPHWQDEAIKIKGTNIPIIATDVCSTQLMNMGIIPTYIATYEEAYKRINEKLFDFKRIDKHSIQVIGAKRTREWMDEELDKIDMDLYRYIGYSAQDVDNVGIFACMFAQDDLKADKIILIGMNSWAGDKGNPYLNWYVNWRKYLQKLPQDYFINCTQGGLLYTGKVIECDYNNLVIQNTS